MNKIAIYGAGGFGKEVACMLEKINHIEGRQWELVGFFDDGKDIGETVSHFGHTLGGIEELNNWPTRLSVALCFGNPQTVKTIRDKITNNNIIFPNLIDPSFSIADTLTFTIGEGNIIKGRCSATTNVTIGNFNLLNGDNSLGHDVTIGDYNTIMPGARISGEVTIGTLNLIGADSFIRQQVNVGSLVTLSPLSALLTNPKDSSLYIGNPAKRLRF